jgi:serine/threonine protein kinase
VKPLRRAGPGTKAVHSNEGWKTIMTLSLPPMIGPFQVQRLLGMGATAQVYLGQDPTSKRLVAIKALHPHLSDSSDFVARFERETRTTQTLDHPAIACVLDHGCDAGRAYVVMDYIPGPSLKSYLHEQGNQPLAVGDAVRLVATVADALAYAHSQGIVHRDVKPSNILLREGQLDSPVLTDFGIARLLEATLDTAPGTTLGTPAYMAPEQGQGKPADVRSDIYALGAVLFEMVTGQPPFRAESPYAVVLHHIHTPPPRPRDLRPDLPEAVEKVILKALAKSPEDRYPSAVAFATALRQSLAAAPRLARRPPRRISLYAGAGLLLLLLLVGMAWTQGWLPVGSSGAVAARPTATIDTLILQGPPAIREAWLDPDLPDRVSAEDPKVHLQGPSTPDRIAYRLALPEMPSGAEVLTATLSLYTVPWGEDNRYASIAVHRLLRDWDPATANYQFPWTTPGLQPEVDYQVDPFLTMILDEPLRSEGWLDLDITSLVRDWLAGEANHGLLLRMTDDSYGMAHLWVYTGEYEDPDLRPKLSLVIRRP